MTVKEKVHVKNQINTSAVGLTREKPGDAGVLFYGDLP
jgi:hypothetical protein